MKSGKMIGIAVMVLTAVLCGAAAAQPCALYIKNGEVCFIQGGTTVCQAFWKGKIDDVQEYRCILADIAALGENCDMTVVAQNYHVYFNPFRMHHAFLHYRNPSRQVYSIEELKKNCRSLQPSRLK